MDNDIYISVQHGDALNTECDVLVLKYAQYLYGVDAATVGALESAGVSVQQLLPKPNGFRLFLTHGAITAPAVLFVGVPELGRFDYAGIRDFARCALTSLSGTSQSAKRVSLTIHGTGYGLDESESFLAEVAGLLDALQSGEYPESLTHIVITERNLERVQRLKALLAKILPSGIVNRQGTPGNSVPVATQTSLANVGERSRHKRYVFTAMPFAKEFEDRFHYGMQRAAEATGFLCERADLTSFTGDVLDWVRKRIDEASFVVADLTTANPNVYLEVGYAWGRKIPTILLVSETNELKFDVHGQRCLVYSKQY